MNSANLLKEYLVNECGFDVNQVFDYLDFEVVVQLSGRKLIFLLFGDNKCLIDCYLTFENSGSFEETLSNYYNAKILINRLDLKDSDSFNKIWVEMSNFLPKNRPCSI